MNPENGLLAGAAAAVTVGAELFVVTGGKPKMLGIGAGCWPPLAAGFAEGKAKFPSDAGTGC